MLKNPLTYEIMTPQSVGLTGSRLTVGKLSGRRGLQGKLKELGYDLEGEALDAIYQRCDRARGRQEGGHGRRPLALVEQQAIGTAEIPDRASRSRAGASPRSHGGASTGNVTAAVSGRGA